MSASPPAGTRLGRRPGPGPAARLPGWFAGRRPDVWWLVSALAFAAVLAFLVWPLVRLLGGSVVGESGGLTLAESYGRALGHRYYRQSLVNSLLLSALATVGATRLGTPLALAVMRYPLPGKAVVRTVATLTLLSPPFIGAYSWVVLFGRSGLANRARLPATG